MDKINKINLLDVCKGFFLVILNNALVLTMFYGISEFIREPSVGILFGFFLIGTCWLFTISVLTAYFYYGRKFIKKGSN